MSPRSVHSTPSAMAMRALGVAVAALLLTYYVGVQKAPLAGDVWLTRKLQTLDWFERPALLVNWVGDWVAWPSIAVLLVIVLAPRAWKTLAVPAREYRAAVLSLTLLIPLSALDNLLKRLVQSPRPMSADGVQVDYFRNSHGFPSGHVFHDVLLYGAMAVVAPRWLPPRLVWPARALLVVVIVLAGPSRVFVGAHWPSDTGGGYLWGSAALLAALALGKWAAGRTGGRADPSDS